MDQKNGDGSQTQANIEQANEGNDDTDADRAVEVDDIDGDDMLEEDDAAQEEDVAGQEDDADAMDYDAIKTDSTAAPRDDQDAARILSRITTNATLRALEKKPKAERHTMRETTLRMLILPNPLVLMKSTTLMTKKSPWAVVTRPVKPTQPDGAKSMQNTSPGLASSRSTTRST